MYLITFITVITQRLSRYLTDKTMCLQLDILMVECDNGDIGRIQECYRFEN